MADSHRAICFNARWGGRGERYVPSAGGVRAPVAAQRDSERNPVSACTARTNNGNLAVLFSQRYKPHLENWQKKMRLNSTFFRYSARSPYRATKPSRGWLRVVVRKPRLFCWSLGRYEIKLRRKQGPTGEGVRGIAESSREGAAPTASHVSIRRTAQSWFGARVLKQPWRKPRLHHPPRVVQYVMDLCCVILRKLKYKACNHLMANAPWLIVKYSGPESNAAFRFYPTRRRPNCYTQTLKMMNYTH